ncbi:DegT/DnrJ/EryC1/StrS family aminotransferase [Streptacidiphilus sp. EB129]|uniref:DegT/DnrJ/EryC1/StrS family aminotransferase n=1 Tax=Streptacidiphilus sp. EB129 TaxID=3156262 RepID=UPI003512414B
MHVSMVDATVVDGGASAVASEVDESPIPFARTEICPEAREAARLVLESGWVSAGPQTGLFEREFADRVGARHGVAVSSCTAAIELALRALRLPPQSVVLVPTLTFCGAAQAVVHAGLRPLLVDVDPGTAMPTPGTVAHAVRDCGPAQAMMVMHYGGSPAPVEELAEAAGLPLRRVVEDAAHALGTSVGGRPVGSLSEATCFSFYATKNLPIGEGGMVTTDDDDLAEWVRRARLHGMSADAWRRNLPGGSWQYTVDEAGLKANMTDLQAAIGRAQLHHLGDWQHRREVLAARYTGQLRSVPGLVPPSAPRIGRHAWHLYAIRVLERYGMSRDELLSWLAERGIGSSVHFIPLHQLWYFRRTALRPPEGLPGADALFPQLLSLPLHPGLTDDQVDRVCAALAAAPQAQQPRTQRADTPAPQAQEPHPHASSAQAAPVPADSAQAASVWAESVWAESAPGPDPERSPHD